MPHHLVDGLDRHLSSLDGCVKLRAPHLGAQLPIQAGVGGLRRTLVGHKIADHEAAKSQLAAQDVCQLVGLSRQVTG